MLNGNNQRFSFCNHSYILTATTKTDILKVESMVQMRHELQVD
jgi:hypothetical protein